MNRLASQLPPHRSHCPALKSLDPLKGCVRLEILDIGFCSQLSHGWGNLEFIAGCSRMRSLGISGLNSSFSVSHSCHSFYLEKIAAELEHLRGMHEWRSCMQTGTWWWDLGTLYRGVQGLA